MATKTHSDLAYLCRALKAPSLAAAVERLGERTRAENWSHEEFLAACLEREVSSRADHGGENRIRAVRFPARKSLDDFDFDHQRSLKRDVIAGARPEVPPPQATVTFPCGIRAGGHPQGERYQDRERVRR